MFMRYSDSRIGRARCCSSTDTHAERLGNFLGRGRTSSASSLHEHSALTRLCQLPWRTLCVHYHRRDNLDVTSVFTWNLHASESVATTAQCRVLVAEVDSIGRNIDKETLGWNETVVRAS